MKNTIILLAFLLLGSSVAFAQWQPYGQTLTGENDGDRFGNEIGLSGDGKTLVIGVANSPDFGVGTDPQFNAGKIQIYEFLNDSWTQLGSDIDGGNSANLFGANVAISKDGFVIAGAGGSEQPFNTTRVFELINSDWAQKGSAIPNINQLDHQYDISLNEDGTILAISSQGRIDEDKFGAVAVYKFENNQWQVMGSPIYGDTDEDRFGLVVELSSDGMTFVASDQGNDANATDAGIVKVYSFNGSSWIQVGADILGINTWDRLGYDVSINNAGDRIALVADWAGADNRIEVYKETNGSWQQIGNSIFTEESIPTMRSCALNGAGDLVIIGSSRIDAPIRVLKLNGASWEEVSDQSIDSNDIQIAIDNSGGIIASASPLNPTPGQVRLFKEPSLGVEGFKEIPSKFLLYPNPSSGVVTFESLDEPILSFSVFSTNGYLVKSERTLINHHKCKVDLTDLAKGLYFVILTTSSHNYNGKIILK